MDWKTSLDTTFSDIWRGQNLRRLLALWLVSLAALALYGTTTNSIPLPDITPEDGSALSHGRRKTVARAVPSAALNSTETMSLFAHVKYIADETAAIARALSPTVKVVTQVANACETSSFRQHAIEMRSYSMVIDSQRILDALASNRVWQSLPDCMSIQQNDRTEDALVSASGGERSIVDRGLNEEAGG